MCFSIGLTSTQLLLDSVFTILVLKFMVWVSMLYNIHFYYRFKKRIRVDNVSFLEYAYGGHALACSGIFTIQPKDVCELGAQFQFR